MQKGNSFFLILENDLPALRNVKAASRVHNLELSTVRFVHEDGGGLDLEPCENLV